MTVTNSVRESSASAVRAALTGGKRDVRGIVFAVMLLACLLASLLVLTVLLWDVVAQALPVFEKRSTGFLQNDLASSPDKAGVSQGIWGSLMIAAFVILLAFPVGIAAGVYLEEYAHPTRLTRFIQLNIRNLAGVPSVVYGILGLVVFVENLDGITGGRSVIAAGITLAILVLPIIIITTAESVSAVPQGLREAGFGVGATRWETTRDHVLPYAAPGILTGTMLAVARALGEAAPLLLIGAITGRLATPAGQTFVDKLQGKFTAMPIVIYGWANEVNKPGKRTGLTFEDLNAAAIVVLLAMLLLLNIAAILLRNRFERRRQG
ncbi:MAG TPA: phosphate ABC transporter permease PstA [Ilumatobacteraceae bacterium]|nr:phosphate ABC transporter permease PstA [Ilumatobacteraceae bacterium]